MLLAMYYFTKWTEAVPLKNMTYREVIEFIMEHILFIDPVFLKVRRMIKLHHLYQRRYMSLLNLTKTNCSIHVHTMLRSMIRPSLVIKS